MVGYIDGDIIFGELNHYKNDIIFNIFSPIWFEIYSSVDIYMENLSIIHQNLEMMNEFNEQIGLEIGIVCRSIPQNIELIFVCFQSH